MKTLDIDVIDELAAGQELINLIGQENIISEEYQIQQVKITFNENAVVEAELAEWLELNCYDEEYDFYVTEATEKV